MRRLSKSQLSSSSNNSGTLFLTFCPLKLARSMYKSVIKAVVCERECVCLCVCEREEEKEKGSWQIPSEVQY